MTFRIDKESHIVGPKDHPSPNVTFPRSLDPEPLCSFCNSTLTLLCAPPMTQFSPQVSWDNGSLPTTHLPTAHHLIRKLNIGD